MVQSRTRRFFVPALPALAFLISLPAPVQAEVRLHALFSDNVVLQQGRPIPVWGWADPGERVRVEFHGTSAEAVADGSGDWRVSLPAASAGGPYELRVSGTNSIRVRDVLVGEVWICSGQSNMEWKVANSMNAEAEATQANHPRLRMFTVPKKVSEGPQREVEGNWVVSSPETVAGFSAVGYFFGRRLLLDLDVPVGLIHTSWGGTPAEAWTSRRTLEADHELAPIVHRYDEAVRHYPERFRAYEEALRRHQAEPGARPTYQADPGNQALAQGWADPAFSDGNWPDIDLPRHWETVPGYSIDGAVWFRREVEVPAGWAGRELELSLGPIDDFDTAYFNGVEVGATGPDTPDAYQKRRVYPVRGDLVRAGRAAIAVRVFDHFGEGGFAGARQEMKLGLAGNGQEAIPLAGSWKLKVEHSLDPAAVSGPGGGRPSPPMGPGHSHSPAGLYHAMLHPLAPYGIRGAIWYQGETNAGRARQYQGLLAKMIGDWRELWGQGDFPFGIVQLANFMKVSADPQESAWAELREAQALVARSEANVGLAVAIDIGEADDIHPRNKQDVGARLGRWALSKVYGRPVVGSGPTFAGMEVTGDEVRVRFEPGGSGLAVRGDELRGFAVAGRDRIFHWAEARIQGNDVVVRSDAVAEPVAVRYGWADNPVCNLYNREGLPAVPFRSDHWPGVTLNSR